MSEFTVYGVPGSPYVRAALLGLEEKGADWRLVPFGMGEMHGPKHLQLNAFGRIPIVDHGDFRLYETQAILRYVDRAFEGTALQPTELKALARMDQVMNIIDWYLFPQVTATIPFQRIIAPLLGRQTDETVVAAAVPHAHQCAGVLDAILAGKPYVGGDAISLADIMLVTHIEYLSKTPEGAEVLKGTQLAAWLDRMETRDSVKATAWRPQSAAA